MTEKFFAGMSKSMVRLALASAVGLCLAGSAWAADWPQYRGPNQDGVSTERILKTWPAAGLKTLWKLPMGEAFGTFAVRGDKTFLYSERGGNEVCLCLDVATGKELWATTIDKTIADGNGSGPRSTPVIDGQFIYVFSTYLKLSCLAAADGKVVWTHDLAKEFNGQLKTGGIKEWGNAQSALVEGNLVIVAGGGAGSSLMAFDKTSGAVAWKNGDEKITHATATPATILGARQIIFFAQSGLVAVEPQTGKTLWKYPFKFSVSTAASPVVSGDIVYCSAGYGVGAGAVKIAKAGSEFTATEIWRTPNKNINHWSTPVIKDGFIYGLFGFKEHGTCPLKCVELATGKEIWSQKGFGPGGSILADGQILVTGDKGQLVLVEANPKEYHELARMQAVTGKTWTMPIVADGKVYVRSLKEAACLDISGK